MTPADIEAVVRSCLLEIAPETDWDSVDRNASLREQLELDSMDFLNFVTAIKNQLGVAIPETDYEAVDSLTGCITYLSHHGRMLPD